MSRRTVDCFSADVGDLPYYEKKKLPLGTWITFRNLNTNTTEEELQTLIINRTGVLIPLERIQMTAYKPHISGAIVSLGKDEVTALVSWALSEGSLHDRKIELGLMKNSSW